MRDYSKKNSTKIFDKQISKLGDGRTKLEASGEIKVYFFRQSVRVLFHAIVCKNLTSAAIGGTNFLKDNAFEQDMARNIIHLNSKKVSVLPTNSTAIMPTAPLLGTEQVKYTDWSLDKPKDLGFKQEFEFN